MKIIFQVKDQQEAEKKKVASMEIQATIEVRTLGSLTVGFSPKDLHYTVLLQELQGLAFHGMWCWKIGVQYVCVPIVAVGYGQKSIDWYCVCAVLETN